MSRWILPLFLILFLAAGCAEKDTPTLNDEREHPEAWTLIVMETTAFPSLRIFFRPLSLSFLGWARAQLCSRIFSRFSMFLGEEIAARRKGWPSVVLPSSRTFTVGRSSRCQKYSTILSQRTSFRSAPIWWP